MNARSSPDMKNRTSRGILHIQLDGWEVKDTRAVAECMGSSLPSFLRQAIREFTRSVESKLNIAPFTAHSMGRKRRIEMGRRLREFQWATRSNKKLN